MPDSLKLVLVARRANDAALAVPEAEGSLQEQLGGWLLAPELATPDLGVNAGLAAGGTHDEQFFDLPNPQHFLRLRDGLRRET
jgi:hypothetical protein